MVTAERTRPVKSLLLLIAVIFVGIALNILGTKLNELLGLPLYLDDIGTILTAAAGGYIPCITVGFFSNVILGIFDHQTTFYCFVSVLIALTAVLFKKRGYLTRFPHVFVPTTVFAVIGGIAGGLTTWLIKGMSFGEGFTVDLAATLNSAVPMGYFLSNMLSVFLMNFIDKFVVVLVAQMLYLMIPKRIKQTISAQSWHRVRALEQSNVKNRKKLSLSVKSALLVTISITVVASGAIGIGIVQNYRNTVYKYKEKGQMVTEEMAKLFDRQTVEDLLKDTVKSKSYSTINDELNRILHVSPEIQFLYAFRVSEEGSLVVYDLPIEGIEPDVIGDTIENNKPIRESLDLFLHGQEIPTDITFDEYGWLFSVYRPVFDEDGSLLCYVIADMSMGRMFAEIASYLTKMISIFLGFLIMIGTYAVWLTDRFIIHPIDAIADVADRFTYDTKQARDESIRRVEELEIHTGDELENLYTAYKNTAEDMVRYIDEVQNKSDRIERMQNGVILVLADMVESRDPRTGDHVHKTAAYASVILRQMKKEGIYADQLTEDFIKDVVNTAPLHDVGKIKISDTILNKDGPLTDEEFRIMRSHTTSGKEIIDRAIETVAEESGFLNEARNLAAYHHEKWDGSGYPNGLSGEDIPLSARVMAVADVFDALVSRRSYKEPFPIDKALLIIREGAGSHFDPAIVAAFLDAEEEIRRIAERNSEA